MNYKEFKEKYPETNITEEQYKELAKIQNAIGYEQGKKETKDKFAEGLEADKNLKINEIIETANKKTEESILSLKKEIEGLKKEEPDKNKIAQNDFDLKLKEIELKMQKQIDDSNKKLAEERATALLNNKFAELKTVASTMGLRKDKVPDFKYFFDKHFKIDNDENGMSIRDIGADRILLNDGKPADYEYVIKEFITKEADLFETPKNGLGTQSPKTINHGISGDQLRKMPISELRKLQDKKGFEIKPKIYEDE